MIELYESTKVLTADSMPEVLGAGGEMLIVTGPELVVTAFSVSVTPAIAFVIVFVGDATAAPPSTL